MSADPVTTRPAAGPTYDAPAPPVGRGGLRRRRRSPMGDPSWVLTIAVLAAVAYFLLPLVWILVALVVTTRDPRIDPGAGFVGAGLIGLAIGLTTIPLFWLAVFSRHHRIAYHGDWVRAVRRGAWVARRPVTAAHYIDLDQIDRDAQAATPGKRRWGGRLGRR